MDVFMKSAFDFRQIELNGYVNINSLIDELDPSNPIRDRLHMCETLFGDRSATVLVLAQDGANEDRMRSTIGREGSAGYRHGPDVKTNINLLRCLEGFSLSADPSRCGFFYANAIWLLKKTEGMSGAINRPHAVYDACAPVFWETVRGLEKLKLILCLGEQPYNFLRRLNADLEPNWRIISTAEKVQEFKTPWGPVKVAVVPHPSPRSGGRDIGQLKVTIANVLRKSEVLPLSR
jgi:hypothetical protein